VGNPCFGIGSAKEYGKQYRDLNGGVFGEKLLLKKLDKGSVRRRFFCLRPKWSDLSRFAGAWGFMAPRSPMASSISFSRG
jgi:hypothetical protein